MKEILISIKPEWVAKILNGEKTIEIRKTMPRCDLPVKVYIYCTHGFALYTNPVVLTSEGMKTSGYFKYAPYINGKVVAEFTLNKITELNGADVEIEKQSCLTIGELYEYSNGKNLFAWHIEDLIIYDKPKELSELGISKAPQSWQYVKNVQDV